ncbi:hypothetical protein SAMN05421759_102645 [Roseivivax lentus]|uniref:DUF4760 domain-containing protein n=1 Tax=Roseivivax lentus TaxID=633194 RepID=A0A1N7LF10_9RHOB|nr:hypothetical protein [Roseivivax lentus]SIS72376.1 hypothetical protein SAMN05421759_102645 [Roseivivax lentus]
MNPLDRGNFALGFFLGFIVAGSLAFVFEMLGTTVVEANDVIAFASAIIALAAVIFTFLQHQRSIHQYDAEFIFSSEREYGQLFENLRDIGDWTKKPENQAVLTRIPTDRILDDYSEFTSKRFPPDEIWEKARPIKSHFKSIALLRREGVITKRAAKIAIQQAGFDLLIDHIWKMDVGSYYYTWRQDEKHLSTQALKKTHSWYEDLIALGRVIEIDSKLPKTRT